MTTGFLHQLRLLLWKNFTLKKRRPYVLLFELFIPLVLFLILLGIRKKQPANPENSKLFAVRPLPSAGIMSIAESFCDSRHSTTDQHGFPLYPNSTVHEFLSQFTKIVEHNNFFEANFKPSDMDQLPQIYKSIIDDPVAIHDSLQHMKAVRLSYFLRDSKAFQHFLISNLSMSQSMADNILESHIDLNQLYRLLLNSSEHSHQSGAVDTSKLEAQAKSEAKPYRLKRSLGSMTKAKIINKKYKSIHEELLKQLRKEIHKKELKFQPASTFSLQKVHFNNIRPRHGRRGVRDYLWEAVMELMSQNVTSSFADQFLASLLKKELTRPDSLHYLICETHLGLGDDSAMHIMINNSSGRSHLLDSKTRRTLCEKKSREMFELSHELTAMIDVNKIALVFEHAKLNITTIAHKMSRIKNDIKRYVEFQRDLYELQGLVSHLPNESCLASSPAMTADRTTLASASSQPGQQQHTSNTGDTGGSGDTGGNGKLNKYAGLLKIWNVLQRTVCGQSTISDQKIKQFEQSQGVSLKDVGLSKKQQDDLYILIHVLYSNPKVLYAPNNTQADTVIEKANKTFALLGSINDYATRWMNVSKRLRKYLHLNSTVKNLQTLKDIQHQFKASSGFFSRVDINDGELRYFVYNATVPDQQRLLSQLDMIDNAACSWIALTKHISLNVFQGFKTEEEIVDYVLHHSYWDNVTVLASVIFSNLAKDGKLPAHVVYKIRQNASFTENTKRIRPKFWFPGPKTWGYSYYQFGFVWIQDIIERAIIDIQVGHDVTQPGTYLQQFPYPCYLNDQFLFMIEHVMPLCLTISWVYFVAMLVQSIVYEKEQRLKEVMKMMGMNNSVHWCAWFITSFTQMTLMITAVTTILKYGSILTYSNFLIVFLVLEMFAIATISFCFLVSVIYSKARLAAACAGIVYLLSYVPYMYIAIREEAAGDKISAMAKSFASLLSTTAFGLGAKYFAFYEIEGVGVQWDNIGQSPVEDDDYNLYTVLVMLLVDAILYNLLAWYIENVHPGSYGLPKPWYFLFTKTYWCGIPTHPVSVSSQSPVTIKDCCQSVMRWFLGRSPLSVTEEDQACAMTSSNNQEESQYFEDDPSHLYQSVCIENLVKRYKSGKVAVNGLTLNLYEDQITSFLGHNGAGKTTTMSILTGLFPHTDGSATIYGHDIRTEMTEIRKSLGMCPQHNVLFDKLTVEEHLWFYAALKGMKFSEIKQEMNKMIDDVGLLKKRHHTVDCLSGGMQRKLSVAMAFVAGSKMVILDEPTAGIDPFARRAIWELLLKYKHGRTILLSTHHMDEADLLGDRIAIISNGQLKCCGSSLFLKSTFGDGYHLSLVKKTVEHDTGTMNSDDGELDDSQLSQSSFVTRCSEVKVTEFIKKHVQSAYLKLQTNHELHYILPFEEAKKGAFEKLFQALEREYVTLNISSYGVVDTLLEEVFLKVADQSQINKEGVDDVIVDNLRGEPECDKISEGGRSSASVLERQQSQLPQSELGHRRQASDMSILSRLMLGDNDLELHHMTTCSTETATQRLKKGHRRQRSDGSVLGVNCALPTAKRGHRRQKSDPAPAMSGSLNPENTDLSSVSSILLENEEDPMFCFDLPESQTVNYSDRSALLSDGNNGQFSNESTNLAGEERHAVLPEGAGSYVVSGSWLIVKQFLAVIVKRFYYIRRNWKSLFTQIILPALFVSVAMTVALSAPKVDDLPPLVLSPAQYYKYTQPKGAYMPYGNEMVSNKSIGDENSESENILKTLSLPSGLSATCVLKSALNSTYDNVILHYVNISRHHSDFTLLAKYFQPGCQVVFKPGIPMSAFVPPLPRSSATASQQRTNNISSSQGKDGDIQYYPECHCADDSRGFVCSKDGFVNPRTKKVVTSDVLVDLQSQDVSKYLLNTVNEYRLHRYGALSVGLERQFVPKNFGRKGPSLLRHFAVRDAAKVWFNNKGYHSMPSYLNVLNNAILRASLPESKGNPAGYGITLINHPINNTNVLLSIDRVLQGSDVLIAIFIIVAMSFVPASFVLFLVYERATKSKHLQFVCGMNPIIYWLANYVWDMCNYLIPGTCCIIILLAFDIPAYVSKSNFPAVISLFLLYGWSITPMMYPASFVFKEPSTAYIFLIVINLFIGITCIITSFLLEMFQYDKDLQQVHDVLKVVFTVFPNYCLGRGLMDIAFNEYRNEYFIKTGQLSLIKSPLEWKLTMRSLVAMAIMGLVFFLITLICEFKFFRKQKRLSVSKNQRERDHPADEDGDVFNERKRVLRGSGKTDLLRLENLTKVFKTKKLGDHLAVDRLCLGVPQGECFGLLGVNGAGKTTTFKMLTGDIVPSGGEAFLHQHSILSDMLKVRQSIGYCPQIDALYDELTAREHLQLYARLRGVPFNDEKKVVDWALKKLSLLPYADKPSVMYSGGTKRKLSTAIALIGHPPVIFLDEPTTGMDPHSRRFLWDLILGLVKDGRSVILTSHSMEECEVLCSRVAIMVNGRFKCLGSIQHLKSRFGEGYTITVRVKGHHVERSLHLVMRFIQRNFPKAILKEEHHNVVQYELPSSSTDTEGCRLSDVFAKMEQARSDLQVEDYSVCQNTLDNVFINFVKQQVEIQEEHLIDNRVNEQNECCHTEMDAISPSPSPSPSPLRQNDLIMIDQELIDNGDELEDEPLLFSQSRSHLSFMGLDTINGSS